MDNIGEGDVDLIKAPIVIDNVRILETILNIWPYFSYRVQESWKLDWVVNQSHLLYSIPSKYIK